MQRRIIRMSGSGFAVINVECTLIDQQRCVKLVLNHIKTCSMFMKVGFSSRGVVGEISINLK